MKNSKYLRILIIVLFQVFTLTAIGEMTEPGEPGGEPSPGDPPLGGGAPVGSGVILLLTLGAAYGGKKVYDLRKERKHAS